MILRLPQIHFLKEAASVELGSEHPLAMAIVERAQQDVGAGVPKAEAFEALAGRGVKARVKGRAYLAEIWH